MSQPTRPDRRIVAFVIFSLTVTAAGVGYVTWSRRTDSTPAGSSVSATRADARVLELPRDRSIILFRNTDLGPAHGRMFVTDANRPDTRLETALACERVHFSGDRGVCLTAQRGATPLTTSYSATTFDDSFTEIHSLPLPGLPSRVRLSPSGRLAGITVFVSGDSYASGSFSTRAILLDTHSGSSLGDLEQFAITRDGRPFKAIDFNFWGVTFADDQRFYATLQTGGRRYLVEGDISARTGRVIADDIECPALSPDQTRVAFKTRELVGGRLVWRLTVLDLRSRSITFLADRRSVDDQPEWLGDRRVLYGLPSELRPGSTDVWSVAADGSGSPARLIDGAWSPAVVNLRNP